MKLKIGHLADIHVRGLSRHDEVRTVISAFCDDARQQKLNHIVIAGDIWHTKVSGMSPESINLLTWMFRSLADVCTVHVTLGNHDGVLTNFTRQDAISPIIDAISDPRIFLYKDSGVYSIEPGVNLCVYSLFDREKWDAVKPISTEYNIAVFHGSVAEAESETGWALNADVSVKWFEDLGYDIVLLGDIHKRQFLGYREL